MHCTRSIIRALAAAGALTAALGIGAQDPPQHEAAAALDVENKPLEARNMLPANPDDAEGGIAGGPNCAPPCQGDANQSGAVDVNDLLMVINAWGQPGGPADVNQSGLVDVNDLLIVINGWGLCPGAPIHDNCISAALIGADGQFNFCTSAANTDGPTLPGCLAGDGQVHRDVWYWFQTSNFLPANTGMRLDTCGSSFDTRIAVYKGCSCPAGNNILVACNDNASVACTSGASRVQFLLEAGTCYLVRVGGANGESGPGVLNAKTLAPGDECFNAINLGLVPVNGSVSATANTNPGGFFTPGTTVVQAPCISVPDGNDVWYKFQLPCTTQGGFGAVTTCDPFTNFDTVVTMYAGACDGLGVFACNDDWSLPECQLNGLPRKSYINLSFVPQSGAFYYARVSGYNGQTGNFRILVGFNCVN